MKIAFVSFCLLYCMGSLCHAQMTDLARVEYTYIPQSNSDNAVSRVRAFVNYPIGINWRGCYIVPGIEYRYVALDLQDPVPFNVSELDGFHAYRASLAFTFKIDEVWRFALKTGAEINSNFEKSTIINDDINYSGAVFLIRDRTGEESKIKDRLVIGLNYSTNAGRPFPIPILNYYRKFRPNWSYSIGTPKTNLKYFIDDKNSIQSYISFDGFFSNIQNNLEVSKPDDGIDIANNISMTQVLGAIGYEYNFTKHLVFYFNGGHTFYNEIRLRDDQRNSIYKINSKNTFYLRTGIKFKI